MARRLAVLLGVAAGYGNAASPCASEYADWVAEPSVFPRKDAPKHMQGLHVACVWKAEGAVHVEAYKNAVDKGAPLRTTLPSSAMGSWRDFRRELRLAVGFQKKSNNWIHQELKQPFGIFSTSRTRLSSADEVVDAKLVLITEGGQWFWPPIRKGYVRQVSDGLELETMSVQPALFRVRGFLKGDECDHIIKLGEGSMVTSPVSLMDKDKGKASKEFRTSSQARVNSRQSKTLKEVDNRVSRLTGIPVEHNEEVQILKYQKTQYYSSHLDNWDPQYYSGQDTSFMEHGHNNRQITVFWYLTNVSKGGETLFPRSDGLQQPNDNWSCERGLKVKPEKGAVILWYSLHPNGNTDPNGLHAACPVEVGEKWSANYWVWNKPRGRRWDMPDIGVDEEEAEASPTKAADSEQVVAKFVNTRKEPVDAFWKNPQTGEELAMGSIQPGADLSMNSYPKHVWVFRAGSTLVSTIRTNNERNQEHLIEGKMDL